MPSVVLLTRAADEPSGHPVVPRFLRLLEESWDAHLVVAGNGAVVTRGLPAEALARAHVLREPAAARPRRVPAGRRFLHAARRGRRPTEAGSLRSLLLGLEPEIVHFPSTGTACAWLESASGLDSRIVAGFSGDDVEGERYDRLWEASAAFHFESNALAGLARWLGAPEKRAVVVPPLADAELLAQPPARASERNPLRILGVGPLSWRQGYEHAIAAVRLLRDHGVACLYRIVGAGEHEDAVAFARYQLGVEESVELARPAGRDGLRGQLAWADVLLNAAVVPTSPKTVLDAQASGLPVVTTEPPLAGVKTALVVPRRDPSALAGALTLLSRDAALRSRLAEEGRRGASRAEGLDEQLGRFCDLYRAVLSAGER